MKTIGNFIKKAIKWYLKQDTEKYSEKYYRYAYRFY